MRHGKLLTVVTPTYNRGALLHNCFRSLQVQTVKDFEWIIVDDGSTDSTEESVQGFMREAPDMSIVYVRKENGGKHTALNASHAYIRGDYVLTLDSDDTLINTAVEDVLLAWAEYEANEQIGIVTFLKGSSPDEPNAYARDERVPVDIMRYNRVRVRSTDCCEVIRTELFLRYPFPVFEQERFMSEGVLWNRVALTHKCVYINKVIYLCEYLEGGLTDSGRAMRIRNPYGGMTGADVNMNRHNFLKNRLKSGLLYNCYGFFAGLSPWEILTRNHENFAVKLMCMMPGYIMYCLWKKRYG